MPRYCIEPDCKTRAGFGLKNGKTEYCGKHKKSGMLDLVHKTCQIKDCKKHPSFGLTGEKPKYCEEHKKPEMESFDKRICKFVGCKKHPSFGLTGEKPEYCGKHKKPEMINLVNKTCGFDGCNTMPIFGLKGEKPKYCKEHKKPGMIDLMNKTCQLDGCDTQPVFGLKGEKPKYCKEHKKDGMINVKDKTCLECNKIPNFALRGEKAQYCKEHKQPEMINVMSKTCQFIGCNKIPTFALRGEKAQYCKDHKKSDMINVKDKTCLECNKQPTFALRGEKAQYCKEHKKSEMIDVNSKTCQFIGCNKRPTFALRGEKAQYCKDHKKDDMINVVSKTCLECCKIPNFGFEGKKPEYCSEHKKPGMIDLTHKKCEYKDCKTRANYGALFQKVRFCFRHKSENHYRKKEMFPVCIKSDCKEPAIYGKSNYPTRCEEHKRDRHFNIVEKPCSSCGLPNMLNEKNLLCNDCHVYKKSIPKRKEQIVSDFVSKKWKFVSTDRFVSIDCSRKRPDMIIDFGKLMLVIEVDESQHKNYACYCEQSRMITIQNDIGMENVVFIRFNPDAYKIGKKQGKVTLQDRLIYLKKIIKKVNSEVDKLSGLLVIYMYYDLYTKSDSRFPMYKIMHDDTPNRNITAEFQIDFF